MPSSSRTRSWKIRCLWTEWSRRSTM